MNVGVIGTGYVGLVAGACFADAGHHVWCVDRDQSKIEQLKLGEVPIYEPGLADVLKRAKSRLNFTTQISEAIENVDVAFIAVGTPELPDGSADLTATKAVFKSICECLKQRKDVRPFTIVLKSTVPIGTAAQLQRELDQLEKQNPELQIELASNPEFLKEGAAIADFMKPDRVVIGLNPKTKSGLTNPSIEVMRELYSPFVKNGNPILFMSNVAAEMTKYAANSFLSVKISFINELAQLADQVGADIDEVRKGFTTDRRINPAFFYPGVGYGGSCFPKDVKALVQTGQKHNVPMKIVDSADAVNDRQKLILVQKILDYLAATQQSLHGKRVAIWGLAFKPQTDDVREAPSREIILALKRLGADVVAYDPVATEMALQNFGFDFETAKTAEAAAEGADMLLIVTEWNEFRSPDFSQLKKLMKQPTIFDGRNVLEPQKAIQAGFNYYCIGRQAIGSQRNLTNSNRPILVAGAAGFIASHLVDALLESGAHVIGVDNLLTGRIANLSHALKNPRFQFLNRDIRDDDFFVDCREIYNMASPASPIDFAKIPVDILETSTRGHQNLLKLAVKNQARILFASSSEVYGDAEIHPQNEDYFGNVNTTGHRSCYDEAKRVGETLNHIYSLKYGIETRTARIFNTYGPRMRPDDGRIVPNFFMQAMQKQPLSVYGSGQQTRSFCYVSDLVAGLICLMNSAESRPTNVGNPTEKTVLEIAETINRLTVNSAGLKWLPLPQNDPKMRRPEITRIKSLGWQPVVSLQQGLENAMAYFATELKIAGHSITTPVLDGSEIRHQKSQIST